VRIVNQRIKTGWIDGALYLEVHRPLDNVDPKDVEGLTALTRIIVAATAQRRVIIDWDDAERVFNEASGTPVRISVDRWIAPESTAILTRETQ
jgi:L,D-transpeptidase ErfK/SrfK